MDYTTLTQAIAFPTSLADIDPNCFSTALQKVTDGRCWRGIRYPLALLLTLLLLAKLAGETTLSGAAHWIWLCSGWLNEHLHLERTRWPAPSTFTSALEHIDPQELTLVVQHV